jgi:Fe-Mn family superoxide dismutase
MPIFAPRERPESQAMARLLMHWQALADTSRSQTRATMPAPMDVALAASFGSAHRWALEFSALANAWGEEPGWILLSYLPAQGRLFNHCALHPGENWSGAMAVLALRLNMRIAGGRPSPTCATDLMTQLDWQAVHGRYQQAVHDAAEPWALEPEDVGQALCLDVRRAGVYAQATECLAGAHWRDPALVSQWWPELVADAPPEVLVYCVAGHEMSRGTVLRLRAVGVNARFLRGGVEAWQARGLPTDVKPRQEAV